MSQADEQTTMVYRLVGIAGIVGQVGIVALQSH